MVLTAKFVRRLAVTLIAFYAFGLGAVAWAACGMDRAEMAQAMAMAVGAEHECHEAGEGTPSIDAVCAAHCASDVQYLSVPLVAIPAFQAFAVMIIEPALLRASFPAERELPPPGPPHRILLHSFQI